MSCLPCPCPSYWETPSRRKLLLVKTGQKLASGTQGGGAGVGGKKKKNSKRRGAALRHLLRLFRCGRLKPGKMVATYFLSQGVTALAGLLLFSFGSLATSQIEVGVRASERQALGGQLCCGCRAPADVWYTGAGEASCSHQPLTRLTRLSGGGPRDGIGQGWSVPAFEHDYLK